MSDRIGPKFKVNDRVIILVDTKYQKSNYQTVVTEVELSPDTFDDDSYIYRVEGIPQRNYLYDTHLELDVQYYRGNKLNKLGI